MFSRFFPVSLHLSLRSFVAAQGTCISFVSKTAPPAAGKLILRIRRVCQARQAARVVGGLLGRVKRGGGVLATHANHFESARSRSRSKLTKRKLQAAPRCCQVKFAYLNLAKHASQKVFPHTKPLPPSCLFPSPLYPSLSLSLSHLLQPHSAHFRCGAQRSVFTLKRFLKSSPNSPPFPLPHPSCVCVCVRAAQSSRCWGNSNRGILENFSRSSACK